MANNLPEFNSATLDGIIEHMADPLDQRTQEKLAEDLNCSVATITRYKKMQHKYIMEQVEIRRKVYIPALRQAAYKALGERIKKSDNALKLMFQLLGDLVERTEQNVTYKTVQEKRSEIKDKLAKLGLTISELDSSLKHNSENKKSIDSESNPIKIGEKQ